MQEQKRILLNIGQVRERYSGVSSMSVYRWWHSQDIGFPKPIVIARRNYWDRADLERWEQRQEARPVAKRANSTAHGAQQTGLDKMLADFAEAGANPTALGLMQRVLEDGGDEAAAVAIANEFVTRQRQHEVTA